MKAFKYIAGLVVVTAAALAINSQSASATSNTCKIEAVVPVTIQDHSKNFTVNSDGTVTAQFKVTGDANCKKEAVLAVWIMPNKTGQPLESQIFFDSVPKSPTKFGPGVHTLTAKLPQCDYWQIDLLESSDPKGFNGTANYGNLMHPIDNVGPLDPGHRRNIIDAMIGGEKKDCTPPKDVCPNIDSQQGQVPAGHQVDANGNCVVAGGQGGPEVKSVQTPTSLPVTGPATLVGTFMGVSTIAGVAHNVIQRRRKA